MIEGFYVVQSIFYYPMAHFIIVIIMRTAAERKPPPKFSNPIGPVLPNWRRFFPEIFAL